LGGQGFGFTILWGLWQVGSRGCTSGLQSLGGHPFADNPRHHTLLIPSPSDGLLSVTIQEERQLKKLLKFYEREVSCSESEAIGELHAWYERLKSIKLNQRQAINFYLALMEEDAIVRGVPAISPCLDPRQKRSLVVFPCYFMYMT